MPQATRPNTLPSRITRNRVTLLRTIGSELVKYFTLRSNRIMLAITVCFIPASASLLAISLANPSETRAPGTSLTHATPLMFVDSVLWVQMLFAIVIALFVTSEYSSGQVKLSFIAAPGRTRVLISKATVASLLGLSTGFVGAIAAQGIPVAILAPSKVNYDYIFADATLLAAKCGLYLAAVGMLVVGLAFLLRSTVVAIILPVVALTILPEIIRSIPVDAIRTAVEFFPSIAGRLLVSSMGSGVDLGPWQGYGVMAAWAAGVLVAAITVVKLRDA